ncbi:hypothetical protein BVG19_g3438 [[Candida] boidinii]|nr:hypothetical protein BVG19_g3438 [[Candida] boidinii]OWB51192.1 hypothetical protein B5S27_g2751 [[Candida] boidinii]OWB83260.1 hypothetical protein B5S33_g1889 [[Candida] boidinii]
MSSAAKVDRLSTDEKNPRGIPKAKFIEKVEDFINPKTSSDADVSTFLSELETRLQQYKFMEESKRNTLRSLNTKVPDIKNNLSMVKFLKEKKEGKTGDDDEDLDLDEDESSKGKIEVNYELNDTLYSTATIDTEKLDSVGLWLGANVMLEYPLDEAMDMLTERLEIAENSKKVTLEDIEYLRENITTMEVNISRVYNWGVNLRKQKEKTAA